MATVHWTRKTAPTGRRLQHVLDRMEVGDIDVNWTGSPLEGCELNARSRTNKLHQLEELQAAGVLIPNFCPASETYPRISPIPGWVGRTNYHTRANDFRLSRRRFDYFIEPLVLTEEKRLHVFKRPRGTLVVIRTAVKVPQEGEESHPWVRSHATGWRFSYRGGSTERERRAACAAVAALGLDFGAVDLGTFCGQPIVLEVNTCPGLDSGGTLDRYAREIAHHAS